MYSAQHLAEHLHNKFEWKSLSIIKSRIFVMLECKMTDYDIGGTGNGMSPRKSSRLQHLTSVWTNSRMAQTPMSARKILLRLMMRLLNKIKGNQVVKAL